MQKKEKDSERLKLLQLRRQRTDERKAYLMSKGYNYIEIWECQYKKLLKSTIMQNIISDYLPPFYRKFGLHKFVDETIILNHVKSGIFFGVLEVDIHVPDDLYEFFKEFSPIFCTANIPFEAFGDHMQNFFKQRNLSTKDKRLLVGGMRARKILLASPLLQWYLQKGLVVTRLYQAIEYCPNSVFTTFVEEMVRDRRKADDPNNPQELISQISKIISNSAYGSLLINQMEHSKIDYAKSKEKACLEVNRKQFKNVTPLLDNIYEIESYKKVIKINVPISLAFFILAYAKLHLLIYFHDVMQVFFKKCNWQLLYCDTDSFFFAFAKREMWECAKKEFRLKLYNMIYNSCDDTLIVTPENGYWFTRDCCKKHKIFDSKTVGLFKFEVRNATKMICLSSKTYVVKCSNDNVKLSCKGCNKHLLHDPVSKYESVLETGNFVNSENRGIKFDKKTNQMYTYIQEKTALGYPYVKRVVQENGIDTEPLNITLSPWEDNSGEIYFEGSYHVLSPYYMCYLKKYDFIFKSAEHLFQFEKCLHFKNVELASEILLESDVFKVKQKTKILNVSSYSWINVRDKIMRDIIELKLNSCREVQLYCKEIRSDKNVTKLVFTGKYNYWSCGMNKRLAEITPESSYPDRNMLGILWTSMLL